MAIRRPLVVISGSVQELATTDTIIDAVVLGSTAGAALGTAAAGVATTAARSDHVHASPASSGTVTSVTGTSPVSIATGTTTPVVSMAAATTSVPGYLTASDWTTFNSKGNVTLVGTQTLTNKTMASPTFTGKIVEQVYALVGTAPALDPANGTIQTWTLTANSTPTDALLNGEGVTLMIDDGTSYTVTWPSTVWKSNVGVAPTLNATGYTAVQIWKVNSVLYGARVGDA